MTLEANPQVGEASTHILQPDVLLPAQLFGPRRKQAPEEHLMMAVLHDAVECLAKHRSSTLPRDRRLFDETQQWFLVRESEWPYSFESICAVLDLDSEAVRQCLYLAPDPHTVAELHTALFQR